MLKRHGWSCQVPVRHVIERDEEAIEMWEDEVWPRLKGQRRTWARQTQAEEDPVQTPPHRRLPHRDRTDHRTPVITRADTTSST
ncbi:winged helix-turn-helix domain-containing protein [Streptomyces canus]|uniref:winged helix-turn-helix domain-containing protein n=1 Tax=Streptomyces canus TaxID=58343 RepID=UPI00382DB935